MKADIGLTLSLLLACSIYPAATQASPLVKEPLQWIQLVNDKLVGWLENENRITELCKTNDHVCRAEKMRPKVLRVTLFSEPNVTSKKVGALILVAEPGRGLSSHFVAANSSKATFFSPDRFDVDWGYGPHFHQTLLERKGPWARFPVPGLASPPWANIERDLGRFSTESVRSGEIYVFGDKSLFILQVLDDGILVREEHPSDMACGEQVRPPAKKARTKKLGLKDIYTTDGHLRIDLKYKRGC